MIDLGELRCIELRDLFSILPGLLAVVTAGDLLVVCVLCAYGTLHIRFLGVDDNYYCVCLVFIFPFIGTYFLNFSNQCYYWTDISKVVFIAHLD